MRPRDIGTLSIPSSEGSEAISLVMSESGSVLTRSGTELSRELFLQLRERRGAMILADDPDQIRRALRLTGEDAGVILRSGRRPRSSRSRS